MTKRLIRLVEDLAAQPTASVPHACGSWAATNAAYAFWRSERVTPDAFRAAHRDRTLARIAAHATVLVIQDTTEIDVTDHPAPQDVGYLDHPKRRGLKVHSVLAIARAEWGIENGLHDRRDVSLAEDASRLRRGTGPQVMAALNNAVVSLVLSSGERNLAAVQRRFAFQFDRDLARLSRTP